MRFLDLLQMNVRYERCAGAELFTDDGRRILDFLSGYCVHNVGHNHPAVVRALQSELERCGPAMIQTHVADLAGELAEKLCSARGRPFDEGLFLLLRAARAWKRPLSFRGRIRGARGISAAEHAFHGLTCGALVIDER